MKGKISHPEWIAMLDEFAAKGNLIQAVFSSPRRKDPDAPRKLSVRPVSLKSGPVYQFERLQNNKAFHDNVSAAELRERLASEMENFKQALFKTDEAEFQVLANRRGELAASSRSVAEKRAAPQPHNRSKSYILPDGEPVPFLMALGVMTPEGKVVKAKFDKFRQINRFLETVSDVVSELPRGKRLKIVDFGCGKSYLTFALYHYLALNLGLPVRIIGLDLKQDVVEACAGLAAELGWDDLTFAVGDIAEYEDDAEVDMVVTLHACDTATDAALLKAIGWNARVILSVPCCQHELFGQISQPVLQPLLKHGILKERFAALVTDAVRANLLELAGYRTQLLEFIDPEHTPKNVLIRAVSGRGTDDLEQLRQDYEGLRDFLSISPYMENH